LPQFELALQRAAQQLCPGCEGLDVAFDSVLGPHFDALYAAAAAHTRAACPRTCCRYNSLRRGGVMVVFGAAAFIKPGYVPNYLRLAVEYLRRPRCDVLEMISQNKGVFGFNLIWCVVLRSCKRLVFHGFVNGGAGCGTRWS
jgi:hypothetical protein